jgi:MFS family permease
MLQLPYAATPTNQLSSRKINIWSCFIVLSPYLGPFVASLVVWRSTWAWTYWIITILWAIVLILIVAFMDETFYNRKVPIDQQPVRKSRLLRLVGIEQWRSRHQRNSFWAAVKRPAVTIAKLPVLLTSLYYVFTFAWVIGLNAATGFFLQEIYHFKPVSSGRLPSPIHLDLANHRNSPLLLRTDGCHHPW